MSRTIREHRIGEEDAQAVEVVAQPVEHDDVGRHQQDIERQRRARLVQPVASRHALTSPDIDHERRKQHFVRGGAKLLGARSCRSARGRYRPSRRQRSISRSMASDT